MMRSSTSMVMSLDMMRSPKSMVMSFDMMRSSKSMVMSLDMCTFVGNYYNTFYVYAIYSMNISFLPLSFLNLIFKPSNSLAVKRTKHFYCT